MSEFEDRQITSEGAESTAEQRQLSRRKVVRAGLIAVPILMTLPVVPAWAQTAGSCISQPNQVTASKHACPPPVGPDGVPGSLKVTPSGSTDPFGASPFSGSALGDSPFKKP